MSGGFYNVSMGGYVQGRGGYDQRGWEVCLEGMGMSRGGWLCIQGCSYHGTWDTPGCGYIMEPGTPTHTPPQVLTPSGWNAFLFLFSDEEASLCVDALNLGSKQVIMMAVNDHSSAYSAGGSHW